MKEQQLREIIDAFSHQLRVIEKHHEEMPLDNYRSNMIETAKTGVQQNLKDYRNALKENSYLLWEFNKASELLDLNNIRIKEYTEHKISKNE